MQANLFLSLGSEENDKMKAAFQLAETVLKNYAPTSLRWCSQRTSGANHQTNAQLSTPTALLWAYAPLLDTVTKKSTQSCASFERFVRNET